MARDPTNAYFAGNDRDRAVFEAGIKLGAIFHQYVGVPLTRSTAGDLERTIEAATRVQPLVEDVRVRIDRKRKFPATVFLRALGLQSTEEIVRTFLTAPFEGGRHQRRLNKISRLD